MLSDLTDQQLLLADFMSELSERCYYAGWMQNLEYVLWDVVINGERKYGHGWISQQDVQSLKDLSTAANAWIIFHDKTEETAIDLQEWKQQFEKDVRQDPALVER